MSEGTKQCSFVCFAFCLAVATVSIATVLIGLSYHQMLITCKAIDCGLEQTTIQGVEGTRWIRR